MSKLFFKGAWASDSTPTEIGKIFPELDGEIISFNAIHECLFVEMEDKYVFMPVQYDGTSYKDNIGMRALINIPKRFWKASKVYYVEEEASYYIFGLTQNAKQVYLQVLRVDLAKYDIDFVLDMRKNSEVWKEEEAKNNYYGLPRVLSILEKELTADIDGNEKADDFLLISKRQVNDFCISYNGELKRYALAFILYAGRNTKASNMQLYEFTFKLPDFENSLVSRLYRFQ